MSALYSVISEEEACDLKMNGENLPIAPRFRARRKRGRSPFPRVKSVSQPRFGLPFDELLDRSGDLAPERFQRGGVDVAERLGDVFVRVFVDVPLLREMPPQLPVHVLGAGLLVAEVGVAEAGRGPLLPGFGGELDRPEAGLEPARLHETLDFECLLNPFVS